MGPCHKEMAMHGVLGNRSSYFANHTQKAYYVNLRMRVQRRSKAHGADCRLSSGLLKQVCAVSLLSCTVSYMASKHQRPQ